MTERSLLLLRRMLAAALGLATLGPFTTAFTDAGWVVHALGAAAVVLAVSLALSPGRPPAVVLLAATASLVAVETVVVRQLPPTWAGLTGTWTEMARCWDPFLAAGPAGPSLPATTTLPALLAAAAVFAGAELAARGRRLAPAGIAAVGAVGLAAFVTEGAPAPPLLTVGLAAGVVALLGLDRHGGPGAVPGVLVAAVGAAAVLAGLLPAGGRAPYPVRQRHRPAALEPPDQTPLARVARDLADPADPVLFRVRIDGPVPHPRVRIATLDDYDGVRWGISRAAAPIARPTATDAGPVVVQRYHLTDAYDSAFLPALPHPLTVRSDGGVVLHDAAGGTLRAGPGGPVPRSYEVASRPAAGHRDDPGPTGLAAPAPPELVGLARRLQRTDARETVAAVEQHVRDAPVTVDPRATPGHSYARLVTYLGLDPPTAARPGAGAGTSEQSAAAFAVLARLAGVPARVVVGYDLTSAVAEPGGEIAVTAHRVHAWAEALVPDAGWVAYDPAPRAATPPDAPARDDDATAAGAAPAPLPVPESSTTVVPSPRSPAPAGRAAHAAPPGPVDCPPFHSACAAAHDRPGTWPWIAAGLALVTPPTAVLGAKALRRRRRRRRADPASRVRGAWEETLDRLRAHGLTVRSSLTADEIAPRADAALGAGVGAAVAAWAAVLDTAVYAAADPPDHLARAAWDRDADLAAALRARTGRVARARRLLDPRPLAPARWRR